MSALLDRVAKVVESAVLPGPRSGSCGFCGLPVPTFPARNATTARDDAREQERAPEPEFCCFGCRMAAEITREQGETGQATWMLTRLGVALFFSMNVLMFTMVLWTEVTAAGAAPWLAALTQFLRYLSLLCALPALFLLGGPLADSALAELRRGRLTADVLLLSGVLAAYVYSAVHVFQGTGPLYLEVGCVVLVLVTLGRWLEATGKLRASADLETLRAWLPDTARLVDGAAERTVSRATLAIGDQIRVLAGERFPCDGRVRARTAAVDEQLWTGESRPVVKEPGDSLFAGTLNLDGDLLVEVTARPQADSFQQLLDLLQRARQSGGRYQRLADRASAFFLPGILVIAILVTLIHAWLFSFPQGLMAGLSVVLIACPCALGLAAPLAWTAALGRAARMRVLVRHGEALERLAEVRVLAFDKTGTLTTGQPEVLGSLLAPGVSRATLEFYGATVAHCSAHACAQAITAATSHLDESLPEVLEVKVRPGRGVQATVADFAGPLVLGSPRFFAELRWPTPPALSAQIQSVQAAGLSLTLLGWGGQVQGGFILRETLRPGVVEALAACRAAGYELVLLTGDHAERGAVLGRELGLEVHAGLLPSDKVQALETLRRRGPVAMFGDGLNDAPALAAADVGLALGCGADLSRESAAICLLSDDLGRVPEILDLARNTVRVIRQNLIWSFAYNLLGVLLAAVGWLNPALAAVLMFASSLWVLSSSLRLGREPRADAAREDAAQEPEPVSPSLVKASPAIQ